MMRTIFAILLATLTISTPLVAACGPEYGFGLTPEPHAHVTTDMGGVCVTTDLDASPPEVDARVCSSP